MNIKKNKIGFKGITDPTYITKQWSRISGYKTRGYRNRVSRVAKSRTIRDNLDITQHVKRNRVYRLVKPTIK
jgi:hypothetical protein